MRMPTQSEDDRLAKTALFTKYVEVLPTALQEWRAQGLGMAFDLLAGIQDVVAVNSILHQNLFRCPFYQAGSKLHVPEFRSRVNGCVIRSPGLR